jgi:hypothetical protein
MSNYYYIADFKRRYEKELSASLLGKKEADGGHYSSAKDFFKGNKSNKERSYTRIRGTRDEITTLRGNNLLGSDYYKQQQKASRQNLRYILQDDVKDRELKLIKDDLRYRTGEDGLYIKKNPSNRQERIVGLQIKNKEKRAIKKDFEKRRDKFLQQDPWEGKISPQVISNTKKPIEIPNQRALVGTSFVVPNQKFKAPGIPKSKNKILKIKEGMKLGTKLKLAGGGGVLLGMGLLSAKKLRDSRSDKGKTRGKYNK